MDLENKNILIAGAAGFIPSTLAQYYLEKGAKVIGLDNFISGSERNINSLARFPKFEFHKVNIYEKLPSFKYDKIDFIFSMASPASPLDFKTIPIEILRVNSEGTLKLLDLARRKGSRFLEASTSEVYGDPKIHPQKEEYFGNVNPTGPRSCYDESKRFAEAATTAYLHKHSVDTRIIRIFNTYGPRMRANDGRVIPNFINQALRNEPITIYGTGSQTRSFCYVTDLIEAINDVMFNNHTHYPINVGNDEEHTVLECANTILELLGSSSKLTFEGLPWEDPKRRKPCLYKLKSINKYSPKVSFKEGILNTADYFRSLDMLL